MDIQRTIKDALSTVKENYILAAPTLVASFIIVFISFFTWDRPVSTSTSAFIGLAASVVILFAHGVTLVMARELHESGSTALSTAIDAAKSSFVHLISISLAITFLVLVGFRFFLAPGLVAAYFLIYALPVVASQDTGAIDAIKQSFHLALTHTHDTFVLVTTVVLGSLGMGVVNILLGSIPLLGDLAVVLLTGAFGGIVALVVMHTYLEVSMK